MSNEFEMITDDNNGKLILANCRGGRKLDLEQTIGELNDLERTRLRKGKEIEKLRRREEKFQSIISGLMAYIELRVNQELWWDWNE